MRGCAQVDEEGSLYGEFSPRFSFHLPIIFTVDQSKIFLFVGEKSNYFPYSFSSSSRFHYEKTGVKRMNGKGNHQKSTSIVGHRDFFSFQQIEFEQIFERSIIDLRKLRPDESLLFASMICCLSRIFSIDFLCNKFIRNLFCRRS